MRRCSLGSAFNFISVSRASATRAEPEPSRAESTRAESRPGLKCSDLERKKKGEKWRSQTNRKFESWKHQPLVVVAHESPLVVVAHANDVHTVPNSRFIFKRTPTPSLTEPNCEAGKSCSSESRVATPSTRLRLRISPTKVYHTRGASCPCLNVAPIHGRSAGERVSTFWRVMFPTIKGH